VVCGKARRDGGALTAWDPSCAASPARGPSTPASRPASCETQAPLGIGASVDAVALAREGRLVAHPLGLLLEGLQLTLFSDPHVYVQAVGASRDGGQPATYRLSMRASLR